MNLKLGGEARRDGATTISMKPFRIMNVIRMLSIKCLIAKLRITRPQWKQLLSAKFESKMASLF